MLRSSSTNGAPLFSRRSFAALLGAAATAGLTAACSKRASPAASSPNSEAGFPVTITHAFGETTITKKPERVATLAWANHEVPLALGIVPVGISKTTWGDDDTDGMLPWVKAKVNELGGPTPVIFDETDGTPFETVSKTNPDVILASYSGMSKEDYAKLSRFAAVVPYPKTPWGTTMKQMIQINAQALGRSASGEELIAKLEQQVKDAFAKHPTLLGKKVAWAFFKAEDLSKITIYTAHDPRASFLVEAGMANPSIVEEQTKATKTFSAEISSERPEVFDDVDAFVTYGSKDNAPLVAAMKAHPLVGRIKAVAQNRLVFLGNGPLAAGANPSPLSIPATLSQYCAKLAEGLA